MATRLTIMGWTQEHLCLDFSPQATGGERFFVKRLWGAHVSESGEEFLRKALAEAITELTRSRRLLVIEIGAAGITAYELHRDQAGVPRGRGRHVLRWSGHDVPDPDVLVGAIEIPPGVRTILVCSHPAPYTEDAVDQLTAAHPQMTAFVREDAQVAALLREIVAGESLAQPYDLVVVRRGPSGGLRLVREPLFSIEASRGETVPMTVRCEPSDEHGTVFAVVTGDTHMPTPVSIDAAKVPPGRYDVIATLERPGLVVFAGLPGLARDDRDWAEIVASMPPWVPPTTGLAHLICAVEVNGTETLVGERLSRARQMIDMAAAELTDDVRVSLIAYAAHSYDWKVPDKPVEVLCWAESPAAALQWLDELEARPAAITGYPLAAQLEDALAEVSERLGNERTRTALLLIGDRPPHPPRARSEILPCRKRHDWSEEVRRLTKEQGVKLGAVCQQPAHDTWKRIAGGAPADIDALDVHALAVDLGLAASPDHRIPFPFIEHP